MNVNSISVAISFLAVVEGMFSGVFYESAFFCMLQLL